MAGETPPDNNIIVVHGDVCIRKERKKRRKLILWELLYEFSRSTTLHGLRYITEQGLSIIEKVFWFITFVASVSVCFFFIYNVYEKWQSTPVIVTISEDLVRVNNIPFPSITICPQTKCKASVYNYSKYQNKFEKLFEDWITDLFENWTTPSWFMKHIDLTTVCKNDIKIDYILQIMAHETPRNASLVHNLNEVAESLDIFSCHWRNQFDFCEDNFKKVLTQEGVCYNFNSLAQQEILNLDIVQNNYTYLEAGNESLRNGWHPYYGYLSGSRDLYPRRGRINGATPDLDVVLQRNITEKEESCNTLFSGYKIYIHHPADFPKSSLYYYAALDGQLTTLAVKCNIVNTSSKLLGKSAEERKCYFEGERKLKYFKMYTTKNCMMECLSNYTFYKCGCVGFYMPHNDSNHLCHIAQNDCMSEAEDELADVEASKNSSLLENAHNCNCLPPCYTIEYDAEILTTGFDIKTVIKNDINESTLQDMQFSRIVAFFQQPEFVSMRRSELFGWTDFVANCGGLLGLFLGFSVLSIVEIIYFATLSFSNLFNLAASELLFAILVLLLLVVFKLGHQIDHALVLIATRPEKGKEEI